MKIIICDLDGTLCNCTHRLRLAEKEQWEEFNSKCVDDLVYENIANILRRLKDKETKIFIVTGRTENYEQQTRDWLFLNDIPYDEIFMREINDKRSDHIVKKEIFNVKILFGRHESNIWFVLDDRQSVVDMWRKQGLTCLQVKEGDF